MMNKRLQAFIITLLLSVTQLAQADDDHDEARRLLEAGDILSLENILQKARAVQPGKILEVELESKKGKHVYEIELLTTDGRILELVFDAQTGEHLSTENED